MTVGLQQKAAKGTRSSRRRCRQLRKRSSGKEACWQRQINREISKGHAGTERAFSVFRVPGLAMLISILLRILLSWAAMQSGLEALENCQASMQSFQGLKALILQGIG